MPPKADPKAEKKEAKPHKVYADEAEFDLFIKDYLEGTIIDKYMQKWEQSKDGKDAKAPAAPGKDKDGKIEKVDFEEQVFNKEACLLLAAFVKDSDLEEEEKKEIWEDPDKSFKRPKKKDGKPEEFVTRMEMIGFLKRRCWKNKWIKKNRLEDFNDKMAAVDTGRLELSLLDFNQNDFLSDIEIICKERNSRYK